MIAFVASMFVISWSFPFLLLVALVLSASVFDLYKRTLGCGVFMLLLIAFGVWLTHPISVFEFSSFALIGTVVYMIVGTIWSIADFYFLNARFDRMYQDFKQSFPDIRHAQERIRDEAYSQGFKLYPINVKHCKGYILATIVYWPLSICWFILHDPFIRLATYMYDHTGKIYQYIASKHGTEYAADMENSTKMHYADELKSNNSTLGS